MKKEFKLVQTVAGWDIRSTRFKQVTASVPDSGHGNREVGVFVRDALEVAAQKKRKARRGAK